MVKQMKAAGIVVHHSACPSINGKGYDFMILRNGTIIPGAEQTEPGRIHICLEGDFSSAADGEDPAVKEQLFLFQKLAIRLSRLGGFSENDTFPHSEACPGKAFPWSKLVISVQDGYH